MAGALRSGDEFAATDLAHQLELLADLAPVQIQSIAVLINTRNGTTVQLAQQDISQSLDDGGGSAFQKIGNPYGQAAFFEAYGAVGVGIAAELNLDAGRLGARLQIFKNTRIDLGGRFEK